MSAETERLLVRLFEDYITDMSGENIGFGSFRFRQPEVHGGKYYNKKRAYPKQHLDLFVFTTLRVDKGIINKYNIKRYYEIDGDYYVDMRLGIEEKATSKYNKKMKNISNEKHARFINYSLTKSLVPMYVITFRDGSKSPSENNCYFYPLTIKEYNECSEVSKSDSIIFDTFIGELVEKYLKVMTKWTDDFNVVDVREE